MFRFVLLFCFTVTLPALAAEKHALLIGINDYTEVTSLKNAVADAVKMEQVLKTLGYSTTLIKASATSRKDLLQEFGKFASKLKEGDDAVIFYAGHGVEVNGANYLVPKDSPSPDNISNDSDLPEYLISFSILIEKIKRRDVNANIWIIDACRNNPFERTGRALGGPSGLSGTYGPNGTFLFYAAEANRKSLDRLPTDRPEELNGVFTRAFSKLVMERKTDDVRLIAQEARIRVRDLTGSYQRPSYYDALDSAWCFSPCKSVTETVTLQTADASIIGASSREINEKTVQGKRILVDASTGGSTLQPNVVLIGKKSAVSDCVKRSPDSAPFGCEVLRDAAMPKDADKTLAETRLSLFGRDLAAVTDVNIRLRAPTVVEKVGAVYSCIVKTMKTGENVRLSGIIDIQTSSETFYWGTVDRFPETCRKDQGAIAREPSKEKRG